MNKTQDRLITIAGPLTNLALGLICLGAYHALLPDPWVGSTPGQPWHTPPPVPLPALALGMLWLGWLDLVWAGVNLLPAFPLDGGHLAYGFLEPRLGTRGALMCVGLAGSVLAVIATLVFLVSLVTGLVIWCPPSLSPNWTAFQRGRRR